MTSRHATSSSRRRPPLGREEQRGERLGQPLEGELGARRGLLHVDPVGRDTHEQVGARARAQLARPRGQAVDRRRSAR